MVAMSDITVSQVHGNGDDKLGGSNGVLDNLGSGDHSVDMSSDVQLESQPDTGTGEEGGCEGCHLQCGDYALEHKSSLADELEVDGEREVLVPPKVEEHVPDAGPRVSEIPEHCQGFDLPELRHGSILNHVFISTTDTRELLTMVNVFQLQSVLCVALWFSLPFKLRYSQSGGR
jgi:hypothetical protein